MSFLIFRALVSQRRSDFQTLFGRVFENVGGTKSEGTLVDAVAQAVAE